MSRTVKVYKTPRSNARKNWKRKVNRAWKQCKQRDATAPKLSRDVDLSSTFCVHTLNFEIWSEENPDNMIGPSPVQLKTIKKALISKYRARRS